MHRNKHAQSRTLVQQFCIQNPTQPSGLRCVLRLHPPPPQRRSTEETLLWSFANVLILLSDIKPPFSHCTIIYQEGHEYLFQPFKSDESGWTDELLIQVTYPHFIRLYCLLLRKYFPDEIDTYRECLVQLIALDPLSDISFEEFLQLYKSGTLANIILMFSIH